MKAKATITHEGRVYYSIEATAKLLRTTTKKVREMMVPQGFEWRNVRVNGRIWIGAESVKAFQERPSA